MRSLPYIVGLIAAVAPSGALADPCSRTPAEVVATLGDAQGTPEDGRTAYIPTGLKMLDRDVSYVLVLRHGADDPVEEIAYRLGGQSRRIGQDYDRDLAKDFDTAFTGASCVTTHGSTCSAVYDPAQTEGFAGADLNSGSLYVDDGVKGPAIALINADLNMPDSAPVFLVCIYQPL